MTSFQPDEYWPTDAANYDSFAGFANTTQAEWETQLLGGFNTAFGPWSGVCALLEQVPFIGDLIELGGGPESGLFGFIGAMLEGITVIAENLCALLLGTEPPGDTTPTSMLDGFTGIFGQLLDSPFVVGLIQLGEDTGNLLTDIINALLGFVNTLCSVFTGTYDPENTTPQTIVDGITGIFDTIAGSGFLQAFINFAQASGNLVLKILDGIVRWLDQAWNLIVAMFPTLFGVSPDDVLAGSTAENITSIINDMLTAAMDWLDSLPELLSSLIDALMAMIAAIPELILAVITAFLNWLAFLPEAITSLIEGVLALITELPDLITETINTMVDWITSDTGLIATLTSTVLGWLDALPELITEIVSTVTTWIDSLPGLIQNVVEAFLGWLDAIPELFSAFINAIVSFIKAAPEIMGAIIDAFVALIDEIPNVAETLLEAFMTLMNKAPSIAAALIQAIIGDVIDAIIGAIEDIPIVGGTIAQLVTSVTGLTNTANTAQTTATGAAGGLMGLINNLLAIPSQIIGSLFNNQVDNSGYTAGQLMAGLYSGMAPLNTTLGGAGGTGAAGLPGAAGMSPPSYPLTAANVYAATQMASYQNWQMTAVSDNVAAGGATYAAAGTPGTPWVGF